MIKLWSLVDLLEKNILGFLFHLSQVVFWNVIVSTANSSDDFFTSDQCVIQLYHVISDILQCYMKLYY